MSDTDDAEVDLFSYSALQSAPDAIRPSDIPPATRHPVPPLAPTEVNALAPPLIVETPAATSTLEPPDTSDDQDVLDPDWPRCRKPSGQGVRRKFKTLRSVPELTEEQLRRSPKLMAWRERERNKANARAYRERAAAAKKRAAGHKQKVCRACFRVYLPTDKKRMAPYCNDRCRVAWEKVKFCFDGEAAWLHRIQQARMVMAHPDRHSNEAKLAAEHVLRYAAPDYSPVEPREGTLLAALVKNLVKLREKWAPYAAEAIRAGRSDSLLRPDMLVWISPLLQEG